MLHFLLLHIFQAICSISTHSLIFRYMWYFSFYWQFHSLWQSICISFVIIEINLSPFDVVIDSLNDEISRNSSFTFHYKSSNWWFSFRPDKTFFLHWGLSIIKRMYPLIINGNLFAKYILMSGLIIKHNQHVAYQCRLLSLVHLSHYYLCLLGTWSFLEIHHQSLRGSIHKKYGGGCQ